MDEQLKVIELFGGIGACTAALKRLGVNYKVVDYVEIDKYAVKSYNAINGTNYEPQDITKWNKEMKVDLIMHGSPCQDFSIAGFNKGGDEGSGTRSSLMYETIRIVEKLRPKYVVWENVKNMISKTHKHNFYNYIERMKELGYTSYWQVMNAKDYGIPQNRERVFTISILGGAEQEDEGQMTIYDFLNEKRSQSFTFPPKQELKLKLKDMLEDEVDEKHYLSEKMINYISADNEKWAGNNGESVINKSIATTINTGEGHRRCDASNYICDELPENHDLKAMRLGNIYGKNKGTGYAGNVWNKEGLSPTLGTMQGGNRQPMILVNNANSKGYAEAYEGDSVNLQQPHSKPRRGRVGSQVSQTLQTSDTMGVVVSLKRGYSVNVNEEKENIEPEIDVIGNYSKSNYQATNIVNKNGIAPTVRENHGQITGVVVNEYSDKSLEKIKANIRDVNGCSATITANPQRATIDSGNLIVEKTDKIQIVGNTKSGGQRSAILSTEGIASYLTATDYKQPKQILVPDSLWTKTQAQMITADGNIKRYIDSNIVDEFNEGQCADISFPNGYNKGKRVHDECPAINVTTTKSSFITKTKNKRIKQLAENTEFGEDTLFMDIYNQNTSKEMAGTLKSGMDHQQGNIIFDTLRIRKLTPKECWRLMGFTDEEFEKAAQVNSNTQLYKQAGNSIVVNVLAEIFNNLLSVSKRNNKQEE